MVGFKEQHVSTKATVPVGTPEGTTMPAVKVIGSPGKAAARSVVSKKVRPMKAAFPVVIAPKTPVGGSVGLASSTK